jgi:hypothetical protein
MSMSTVGLVASRLLPGSEAGASPAGSKPPSHAMSSGMLADQPSMALYFAASGRTLRLFIGSTSSGMSRRVPLGVVESSIS